MTGLLVEFLSDPRFDQPQGYTNNIGGECHIRIATTGAHKKGFTVALCATADGQKLPAYIIFKERGGELGKRVKAKLTYPHNVRVTATKKRMDDERQTHCLDRDDVGRSRGW